MFESIGNPPALPEDSQSSTVPGVWVEGNDGGGLSLARVWLALSEWVMLWIRELGRQGKPGAGWNLRLAKRASGPAGLGRGVESSPEGPCGLGPLHLPQASGFAGGR